MPPRICVVLFSLPLAHLPALLVGLAVIALPAGAAAGELFTHSSMVLHNGPGDRFAVLGNMEPGMKISVLWCNASAEWCLIQGDRAQGWVPMDALQPRGATPAAANEAAAGGASTFTISSEAPAAGASVDGISVGAGNRGASASVSAPDVSMGVGVQ